MAAGCDGGEGARRQPSPRTGRSLGAMQSALLLLRGAQVRWAGQVAAEGTARRWRGLGSRPEQLPADELSGGQVAIDGPRGAEDVGVGQPPAAPGGGLAAAIARL